MRGTSGDDRNGLRMWGVYDSGTEQKSVRKEYCTARTATAFYRDLSRNNTNACGRRRIRPQAA
jgi:hypothetical protein